MTNDALEELGGLTKTLVSPWSFGQVGEPELHVGMRLAIGPLFGCELQEHSGHGVVEELNSSSLWPSSVAPSEAFIAASHFFKTCPAGPADQQGQDVGVCTGFGDEVIESLK